MEKEMVEAFRHKAGLSREEFAEVLRISPSQVAHLETGRRQVSREVKARILANFPMTQEVIDFFIQLKDMDKLSQYYYNKSDKTSQ